jgi:integrase
MIVPAAGTTIERKGLQTVKLNQKTATAIGLPTGKAELIIYDEDLPGFGIRVRAGGSRNWVVSYKVGDKHRRLTLGSTAMLNATDARRKAADALAQVRLGQDPAGAKAEARVRSGETMGAVLPAYLAKHAEHTKPRSHGEVVRHLSKDAKRLHGLQLAKVDRRDIAALIAAVATNSGSVTSNRVRASLSAFFAWAIKQGLIERNPVDGTDKAKEASRDRVLSAAELKVIWQCAGGGDYGDVVKLLLLSGQRLSEVAGLRWSELTDGAIELPGERVKNKRAHSVPLSDAARAIVNGRKPIDGRDLVFGKRKDRPPTGWGELKARHDARIAATGFVMPPWRIHDLRRTTATTMAEDLGILPHVVEAVLNHASGHKHGVAGVYNRASYAKEKREALTKWAEHLMAIVEGRPAKVVPLAA